MRTIDPTSKKLAALGCAAAAALLLGSVMAAGAASAGEEPWRAEGRVATSVEIDDDRIVIRTESKDGGSPETIEIIADCEDDVVIVRDGDGDRKRSKWKKVWKEKRGKGDRVYIDWDWSDLDDLDCFEFDDYDDCDGESIVHFGSDIHVDERRRIDGDVVAVGGSVYIEGEVEGDVVAIGGSVTLGPDAEVDGDVVAVAGDLDLRHGSEIEGDAVSVGGYIDDDGADIYGDTVLIEFDLW